MRNSPTTGKKVPLSVQMADYDSLPAAVRDELKEGPVGMNATEFLGVIHKAQELRCPESVAARLIVKRIRELRVIHTQDNPYHVPGTTMQPSRGPYRAD